jgi:hypothetical protein
LKDDEIKKNIKFIFNINILKFIWKKVENEGKENEKERKSK